MNNFFNNVQSFFHSVTTNDRYASGSNNFARRTVSGGFGPAAPLTSDEDGAYRSGNPYGSRNSSSTNLSSSRLPYTPGMRSSQVGNSGNIPLQDYDDGAPPAPAPVLSWKRIDRWMEANYPELEEEISDEATSYDLNELEADLNCTLPMDVRDSFLVHDGQERGGRPCGLIFGLTLLDLESVSEEWTHWKNTSIKILNMTRQYHANRQANAAAGSSSQHQQHNSKAAAGNANGNLSWLDHQTSVPEGAIQRVYAHSGWIPLISDFLGNNIGIDLAPGPKGKWGQVILFGREFDKKYVIAPSWAAFLLMFADDLENGNHYINDETEVGELSFRANNGRLIPYFDVLRSRAERQNRILLNAKAGSKNNSTSSLNNTNPSINNNPNSSNRIPGRNVSGNFRRPNQVPTLAKEARLISPMNSTTNLPATGLSKPKTLTSLKSETNTNSSDSKVSNVESKDENDASKTESKPVEVQKEPKVDLEEKKEIPVKESKIEVKNEDSLKEEPTKKEPVSKAPVVETGSESQKPTTEIKEKKADAKEDNFDISSDDEVDLLKEDLSEVAI